MSSRFDYAIIDAINNAFRQVKASPLVLGATASGVGGPVGGYVGYLTQSRVSYDPNEIAASGTPASGMSLVDNLNHIRFRLDSIESGGAGSSTFLGLTDTPSDYTGQTGKAVIVNATEDGLIFSTISTSSGGVWGTISGVLSDQADLQSALDAKVDENIAIVSATKTKITYDTKGLVTAGADATTADIADSADKRYVTDANLVVIGNTSGTNTGDSTSIAVSLLTTRGDIIVRGASVPERLAIGLEDKYLTSDGLDTVWSAGYLHITTGNALTIQAADFAAYWDAPSSRYKALFDGTSGATFTSGATLDITGVSSITGGGILALGGYTLTVPESLTAAGRNVANTFTGVQTISNTTDSSSAITGALIVSGGVGIAKTLYVGSNIWVVGASAPSVIISEGGDAAQFFRMRDISTNQGEIDKITTSGASIIDINPKPQDGVGAAAFRFFRSSSTTGRASFDVFNANQTTPLSNSSIAGNGYTYLNGYYGNTAIGSAINAASTFAVSQRTNGAGTVTTNGTTTLTGSGTDFVNQFKVGDTITVSGETVRTIATISSATSLTVTVAFSTTASGLTYTLVGGVRFAVYGRGDSYFYGVMYPVQATTAGAPAFANGGIWFDTTLDKLKVGGAAAWEIVLTDTFTADRVLITTTAGNVATDATIVFDSTIKSFLLGVQYTPLSSSYGSIMQGADGASVANFLESFGTGVASYITLLRGRGTHTSPTAVLADDVLGRIRGRAFDGAGSLANSSAEITMVATADHSSTVHGTRLEFWTTPNTASAAMTKSMILDNDGSLAILDGITGPAALTGYAKIYIDTADGDLKIRFSDGTIKTIVVDT